MPSVSEIYKFDELTWPEVNEAVAMGKVPILPTGSVEQHGHHLPLRLPAYKLRIGFTPIAWEPSGRELVRLQRLNVFEEGLFFYAYGKEGPEGHYFSRGEADLRPFRHHVTPPLHTHQIVED